MTDEQRADRAEPTSGSAGALARATDLFARTDESMTAIRAAHLALKLAPFEGVLPAGDRTSDRVARLLFEVRPERPSAIRELGLGAVVVWQSLVERRRPDPAGPVQATILFTDLVGFSSWALRAGDDHVLELLSQVNEACGAVIESHGGQVVKTLGDGTMAVFVDAADAIAAAHEAVGAVSAIVVGDFRPALRAGLHTGTPRAVGSDYLGVDVNIAARVCDAASGGQVYATDTALAEVDPSKYVVRRRRFKAKGVPKSLQAFRVVPRYDDPA